MVTLHTLISEPGLLLANVSALSKLFRCGTIEQVADKNKGGGVTQASDFGRAVVVSLTLEEHIVQYVSIVKICKL